MPIDRLFEAIFILHEERKMEIFKRKNKLKFKKLRCESKKIMSACESFLS